MPHPQRFWFNRSGVWVTKLHIYKQAFLLKLMLVTRTHLLRSTTLCCVTNLKTACPCRNSRSCLVLKQWLVKATTRAVAHCASSFLFVAEWSWQQAQVGSGLQHTPCQSTYCFCIWHLFPVHPNYNSIIESCDSHTFHHLGGQGWLGLLGHGYATLSFPYAHHCLGILSVLLDTVCFS